MRWILAFRSFFAVLASPATAQRIRAAIDTPLLAAPPPPSPAPSPATTAPGRGRSEALTLISTLQREARLLDLVQEPLDGYTDAQIGAAARDVLRDTAKTLQRLLGVERLVSAAEGERIELPTEPSTARWRFVGMTPHGSRATLVHAGWQASHCRIPEWTGQAADAFILAPAEVEA